MNNRSSESPANPEQPNLLRKAALSMAPGGIGAIGSSEPVSSRHSFFIRSISNSHVELHKVSFSSFVCFVMHTCKMFG